MRKHCRRTVRPLVNPIALAISGASVTPKDRLDQLRIRELSCIEAFRQGKANKEDWKLLADVVNIAETMSVEGVGREALPAIEAAQGALERAHDRFTDTGRYGIDGPGLEALRGLYEWHDAQRTAIARSEYERLIQLTAARMRTALAMARKNANVRVLA